MDFDFNWILVPATLIFFVIWLLDKLLFKQRSGLKQKKEAALQADKNVQQAQQGFEQLKSRYPQLLISETVNQADEPAEITQARDRLSQVKVDAVRAHNALNEHKTSPVINWAYDFWPVLAVVLVVRSFFYEPFNIPSESMNPTLETGDFILVNKYAFGVRLPLINTKIIDSGEPQHGDVAVFRFPKNPSISFIKRIIGLPGDHIVFQNGELYVNGKIQPHQVGNEVPLPVKYRDQTGQEQTINVQAAQWVVNLGEHRFISQYIKTEQQDSAAQQFLKNYEAGIPLSLQQNWEVTVPQGQYFAMGDNRDQSDDSRFWGFVPEENLTGRAMFIWMHKKPGLNLPSFERNGRIP
jgi:signal peptidase I